MSADETDLPVTHAAFGYCRDAAGRLLMVANDYPRRGVWWGLPGGGLEPGEDHAACVVREFAEEVGLAVRVGRDLGEIHRLRPDWGLNLRARFYEVTWLDAAPRVDPDEEHVVDFAWRTRDEIAAFAGVILGRRYVLDYLDRPGTYPKDIVMPPEEE